MGTQDAVPQGFRRGLPECPVCGRDEKVVAVPAIFESSHNTESAIDRARMTINDDDATYAQKAAARERMAATPPAQIRSAILAPAPAVKAAGCGCLAFVVAIPAVILWVIAAGTNPTGGSSFTADSGFSARDESQHHTLVAFATSLTVLAGVFLLFMVFGLARGRAVKAGRPAADAIWRKGWYCTRCAVVHFAAGEEPSGVRPGQSLDPDTFRQMVWTAGGYGNRFKPSKP
jgi:hypothetical protein